MAPSFFFFSSRRRHTRLTCDWSSDVCSSDLGPDAAAGRADLLPGFAGPVEQLVEREREVRAVRNIELVLGPDAPLTEGVELGEERLRIEHDQIGRASCRERG